MGSKTPLQLMLEIINDPKTTEERRDRFIVAAAPYLHAKPSTPSVADIIASRFLESSTSLADPSPFADAREALDFLVRRSKASHSGE